MRWAVMRIKGKYVKVTKSTGKLYNNINRFQNDVTFILRNCAYNRTDTLLYKLYHKPEMMSITFAASGVTAYKLLGRGCVLTVANITHKPPKHIRQITSDKIGALEII